MELTYKVSDRPSFGKTIVYALQQLLAILAATIAEDVETALYGEGQGNASVGADIGDVAVPKRDKMPGGKCGALFIIDIDSCGESAFLGLDGVDADNRHADGCKLRALLRIDVKGDDDDGVGVAAYRKGVEELLAFLDAGDLEDGDVVAFGMEHFVKPLDNRSGEPQTDMAAHQDGDAQRPARLQRGGGTGQ